MSFLYLFTRLHQQQVGEVVIITQKSIHEVMEAYPSLALDRVRGFFPSGCVEELTAYLMSLPCRALLKLEGKDDDVVFRAYGVEWLEPPLPNPSDYIDLMQQVWPDCEVLYVHMKDHPVPSLFVRNKLTGRGCTLPADRLLSKDKLSTLMLS